MASRRFFTENEKREAVQDLIQRGITNTTKAKEMKIQPTLLSQWKSKYGASSSKQVANHANTASSDVRGVVKRIVSLERELEGLYAQLESSQR